MLSIKNLKYSNYTCLYVHRKKFGREKGFIKKPGIVEINFHQKNNLEGYKKDEFIELLNSKLKLSYSI